MEVYSRRKWVLFSPGKAMTACLRDYVSWGKSKPCMEVMSCMRSRWHYLYHWQSSEVCWDSSLFLGSRSWGKSGWPQFRLYQSYSWRTAEKAPFYVKADEGSLVIPVTPPSREMPGTTTASCSVGFWARPPWNACGRVREIPPMWDVYPAGCERLCQFLVI